MRVAVIGSGPAGMACAKALVRRGIVPTVLDVGETLPPERQAIVDRMANLTPDQWSSEDRDVVTNNPTVVASGVPKKMVFGSDFHFARDRAFSPTDAMEGLPSATFARGGYSVAWGAALLPAHDSDLADWPIRRADLEPSYRRVLSDFPLSGGYDGLEQEFPLFKESIDPLPLQPDARSLLADFERLGSASAGAPLLCGQARLAVDASACRRCGLCLSGCVYGAIHSTIPDLDRLRRNSAICYESGCVVEKIQESGNAVRVFMRRLDTLALEERQFDYVFVAAGAIQSTRIVLASLQMFDHPVVLKDSQKFIVPLLRRRRFPLAWPQSVALAGVFLEFKLPGVSDHWIHMQVSSVNDYVLKYLKVSRWDHGARRRLLAPLYERLLIGFAGLHSDHSSGITLTLTSDTRGGLPILRLERQLNQQCASIVRKVGRHFARLAWRAHTLAVTPAIVMGEPGGGNHFGGSLPMRSKPEGPLDTDLLGRLHFSRRTHIVDGSILPSIPATTLALLQMANADRIATTCDLN